MGLVTSPIVQQPVCANQSESKNTPYINLGIES
ncbi:hypothetical protein DET48_115104 [Vibrio diazotrophicus]|uniref:Uncharacterized protein n=1 Tax=Vibrio diazotrophicus TaxID=685 RepID=A0A329E7G0_VIBDI|nr:hypothetical protein DET48_115104 [Vibrio diazotrophicus]